MRIRLYLFDYELTFTKQWSLPYFPNTGDLIKIDSLLTEHDKSYIKGMKYGDIAEDAELSEYQKTHADADLLNILYNIPCKVENRSWSLFDGEWICCFMLKA